MNLERENTAKFLKNGDRKAFEWLYLQNEEIFKTYATMLTKGKDAEDLIQLTCVQLLEYDGRAKDPDTFRFKNFFCRSLHNTFINLYRVRKSTLELFYDYDIPETVYSEFDLGPLLYYMDQLLTKDQKRVFKYRMKGVKFRVIADKMKISRNTAVGIFRYGCIKLRPYKEKILVELENPI